MTPSASTERAAGADPGGIARKILPWLRDAAATLDRYGPAAWIGATLLAFILAFPLGIAFVIYLFWSGRMGRFGRGCGRGRQHSQGQSGNAAFDAYREETMRRLEEEQSAFQEFLERLRMAKDKAEFEQFMAERRSAPSGQTPV